MKEKCSDLGELSEEEKSLIAFFRSQSPRVKEILMNITVFEKDQLTEDLSKREVSDGAEE